MDNFLRLPFVSTRDTRGFELQRPQLPITLQYGDQQIEADGLLDTGADVNVLPYSIGMALGANWHHQRPISALSGNLGRYEARGIILTGRVGQFSPVLLAFAWTQATDLPLLLGQMNFFAEFDVCFYRSKLEFEVRPKDRG